MISRQRVQRCLNFDHPDRVPRDLWLLPIAALQHGQETVKGFVNRWPTDFTFAGVRNEKLAALAQGDAYAIGEHRDVWGCVFTNIQAGLIGEVKQPLIADWSDMDKLRPPVEALDFDRDAVRRLCAATDNFIFAGHCAQPFERMQFLRGSENLYLDIAEESSEFLELLRIVREFFTRDMQAWAETDVDALRFNDDWGAQRSLLISPAQWRKLFKPIYADFARIAHESGKKIFMHSDGYIFDIYQDLIEIGIDAVNSQLFCMDIEEIGRRFKGKITFWGEIDRQHILPHGTPADARAAVGRVIDNLYDPAGGVIAQFELGGGAKLENAEEIFHTWDSLPANRQIGNRR